MAGLIAGRRIIFSSLKNTSYFKSPKRHETGYYVLLPEIGEDLPEKNPLLKEDIMLPEFSRVSIERCIAAIGKQSLELEQGLRAVERDIEETENINLFKNVFDPLEKFEIPLQTTWGISKILYFGKHSLMPTESYFNIHKRALTAISQKYNSKPIYEACRKVNEEAGENDLSEEQRRILSKYILENKLNGVEIEGKEKEYFRVTLNQIARRQKEFGQNLDIATTLFKRTIRNPQLMRDFPKDFLKKIAVDPDQYEVGPWTITLNPQVIQTFMEYCPDPLERWNIWQADVTKCSLYGDHSIANHSNVNGLTTDRCDIAKFLGYKNYSEMRMTTKMAGSLENVYNFLETLRKDAFPRQVDEINELNAFARDRGFEGRIEQWDVPYWMRKQKRSLYNFEEEALKEYFPLEHVIDSLFNLAKELFNVQIVERSEVDVWHKDVRFFDIYDFDVSTTEPVGNFYFDPCARSQEKVSITRHAGWVLLIRSRSDIANVKPLSSLIFNFQPPNKDDDSPCLLTFKGVESLFENFGHMLQQLLTRTESSEVAGFSNVEWDAVGTSKFFMSHWLYEPHVLKSISSHYKTGESLDDTTVDNIKKARIHMAGYNLSKELYLSKLDLDLHAINKPWEAIMKKTWREHFIFPEDKKDSHVCSWEAIFVQDQGAAYYSDLWSKMLAADVYSAFQEIPLDDEEQRRKIGKRYKDTFLTLGGSVAASEVFRRFRGRDPSLKALIKNLNLK